MLPLFRKEALEAQHPESLGSILLIQPVSHLIMTAYLVMLASMVVGVFVFFDYTQRITVHGEVAVVEGYAKVLGVRGIVLKRHVQEGQQVAGGDVLLTIGNPRHAEIGEVHTFVAERLRRRHQSVQDEILQLDDMHTRERVGLRKHLEILQQELLRIREQIAAQDRRLTLARQSQERMRGLYKRGFYSQDGMQQRESELIDLGGRRDALLREQLSLMRQIIVAAS